MELNADKRPRSPLSPELRRTLQAEVAEDVRRLGKLLDRDLSRVAGARQRRAKAGHDGRARVI